MLSKQAEFTYTVTKGFSARVMCVKEFDAIYKLFHYIESNGTNEQKMIMDGQLEEYTRHAAYVFRNKHELLFDPILFNFYRLADSSDELVPLVADIIVAAVSNLKYKDGDYINSSFINFNFELDKEFDTKVHDILNMLESKNNLKILNGFFKVYRYLFNKEDILMASFFKHMLESNRDSDMNVNNIFNFVYNQSRTLKTDEDEYE